MEDKKIAAKFSQLFCKPEQLLEDSDYFRNRIIDVYWGIISENNKTYLKIQSNSFFKKISSETGIGLYLAGIGNTFSPIKSNSCPISKFLDTISIVYNILKVNGYDTSAYVSEVGRIFSEEHMNYCINKDGVIRFFVDEEFQNSRVLTLKGLEENGSKNAIQCYTMAYDRLKPGESYDSKAAIRNVFECLESIVKCITGEGQLDDKALEKLRAPLLQYYGDKGNKKGFISKTIHSIKDMVQATHNFRHADNSDEIFEPTINEAACVLSIFSSYIRWILPITKKS